MHVPDVLESVSNLTVTLINSTTVLISWTPPFTLEGVPILGYNVTITNTTGGENETMLVEDTSLLYSIDHPDLENNFTVTVVPINEIGAGQPAIKNFRYIGTVVFYSSISLIPYCTKQDLSVCFSGGVPSKITPQATLQVNTTLTEETAGEHVVLLLFNYNHSCQMTVYSFLLLTSSLRLHCDISSSRN